MKTCDKCVYAEWKRTAAGRMHPDQSGKCRLEFKVPELPNSMYWLGHRRGTSPSPCGGYIERNRTYEQPCPYWKYPE